MNSKIGTETNPMTVKGQLKDWLHATGKDIAKQVGAHIREKGIAYAKEQLGMGMTAHMSGQGYEQSGDGAADMLKESGKQVAKAVGKHLLKHFKQHAVAYAQQHLGNGIMDELKKHAATTGKAIGKAALTTGVSKLASIKDKDSAKAAARDVGASALSEGKSQLAGLAKKHFGGAGTPEQAVKVCAYTVSELRKVITQMRRKLAGLSVEDWLDIHAHRAVRPDYDIIDNEVSLTRHGKNSDVDDYRRKLRAKPSAGGFSMKTKRKHVSQLKKRLHPPVSKMDRRRCVEYIYGTSRELEIDWEEFFEGATERKRVPKGCYKMTGPGVGKASDADVATHRVKGAKRQPSAYNQYMKEKLADKSFQPNIPYGGKYGRFARAARKWKEHKQTMADKAESQHKSAAFLKNFPTKIPKKKKKRAPPPDDSDSDDEQVMTLAQQRAQLASMGLPVSFGGSGAVDSLEKGLKLAALHAF